MKLGSPWVHLRLCLTCGHIGCCDSQCGDHDFKFFVVKSDEVEILDPSGETTKTVTVHRRGEFTGDVAHLTGNPSVVSAAARGECEVYEVSADALRQVLNQCLELSDIILQAFILETSRRGVFAAGDVRADSINRVA